MMRSKEKQLLALKYSQIRIKFKMEKTDKVIENVFEAAATIRQMYDFLNDALSRDPETSCSGPFQLCK